MSKLGVIFIYLFLLLSLCGCRPLGVMSKDLMEDVLFEIHITENAIIVTNNKITDEEKQRYYESIFNKYGISKSEFDKSLEWYSKHPDKYEDIYVRLEKRIDSLEQDVKKYVYHPQDKPTRLDSIDSVDIWVKAPKLLYVKSDAKLYGVTQKDMDFCVDEAFLSEGDSYRLTVCMRTYNCDTMPVNISYVMMRADSICDTVSTCVLPDSVMRKYNLWIRCADTVSVQSLCGHLIDSLNRLDFIEIDTVVFTRFYNKYLHPLTNSNRKKLKNLRENISAQEDSDKEDGPVVLKPRIINKQYSLKN